jgi:uncharacterized protein with GYD domain
MVLNIEKKKEVSASMPTYITLGNFTQMGIEKIKDALKAVGGALKDYYFTIGRYDFVATVEAPNDEALMKFLAILGRVGAVRTETLVAIPRARGHEIVKEFP